MAHLIAISPVIPAQPVIPAKSLPRIGIGAGSTFHVIPVKTGIQLDNLVIEVPPCRINLLNQLKLPFSLPFLNRLLAR